MPVYDNAGAIVLHFGSGDIAVHSAREEGGEGPEDELIFVRSTPHEVGSPSTLNAPQDASTGVAVRMIFESVESLDALIAQAQELRAGMVSAREEVA